MLEPRIKQNEYKKQTITPPIIPAIIPEKTFGNPFIDSTFVEANPTPKQSGNATKKVTNVESKSCRKVLKLNQ